MIEITGTTSKTVHASSQYWRDRLWLITDDTGHLCEPDQHDLYPFTDEFGEEIGVHCCSYCANITIEEPHP